MNTKLLVTGILGVLLLGSQAYANETSVGVSPMQQKDNTPHLIIDSPTDHQVIKGVVIIRWHAQNIRILSVYGDAALAVKPKLGHLHVSLDHNSWHWVQASEEPIVLQGLTPGEHTVSLDLADATHQVLDHQTLTFVTTNIDSRNTHPH
ncbi:hypothetical protein DBL04_05245 [Acinetobacter seifertii]|nr:hypothetical protein DBL04_05245 [Acinetobacter seifertii]